MGGKYYDKIRAAQAIDNGYSKLETFDLDSLAPKTLKAKIRSAATRRALPPLLWLFREAAPIVRFTGFTWVTRHQDVLDVLADSASFAVPYGMEMRQLAGGSDFVLGIDGPAQQRQNKIIGRILDNRDFGKIRRWSAAFAQSLVEGGAGRLDAIADFSVRIPAEICRRYFGLEFSNPNAFADWSLSVSAMLFADPDGDADTRALALLGAVRLRNVIDVALERATTAGAAKPFADMTLVERLVHLANYEPDLGLGRDEARAILLGLVVGFIPTNSLAAGKMIEFLFASPDARAHAVKAARTGDRALMRDVVMEAGRLNPALSPGQWRIAVRDTEIAPGTPRARKVLEGELLMVATASAMRDRREHVRPGLFMLGRQHKKSLVFGHGSHHCLGKGLAVEIITEMFMVLFRQARLRPAGDRHGKMQRAGYFPRRFDLEYDAPAALQTMIIASIPLERADDADRVEAQLRALGNPVQGEAARCLAATNIVHFASASVVRGGASPDGAPHLLLEFNVDGPRSKALKRIRRTCSGWLEPIVRACVPGDERDWTEILRAGCLDLSFNPWRTTGLNFFGINDLSVARIDKQARLRDLVEASLQAYLRDRGAQQAGLGQRAMLILSAIRRGIRLDPNHVELDAFTVQPSRKELALARWRKPKLSASMALNFARASMRQLALLLVPTLVLAAIIFNIALPAAGAGMAAVLGRAAMILVLSLTATLLFWGGLFALAGLLFKLATRHEKPDDQPPDQAHVARLLERENAPGYRQNHIIAVTLLKPGLVRRLSLAVGLWGIRLSLQWFRPGFVVTMGTIHFAKWFRLPGSRKLIFQSNYDGSWESYLEDFITRAHPGQTAAWSNGEGFPKSEGLTGEGARDGDRFKRWVRRQQIPTAFWYCRFPGLTAHEKRANALVHDGLVKANTDSAARSWLDLIGSAQRQPFELESQEIQALVFRGLKRALFTACIPLRLPYCPAARGLWLKSLLPDPGRKPGEPDAPTKLSFGKFPLGEEALYVALSATGLRKFAEDGSRPGQRLDLLKGFSGAFAQGAAQRAAILGDSPPGDPAEPWRWMDTPDGERDDLAADGLLILYAPSRDVLEERITAHVTHLETQGGRVIHGVIRTVTLDHERKVIQKVEKKKPLVSYEHFGFKDGIATPIIRGTEKFTPRGETVDIVEPGEFILGYPSNQGYFAPSVMVPAASDPGEHLPIAADQIAYGFADFNADDQFVERDFGRNGSFLAVRQFVQHVEDFEEYTERQARLLNRAYGPARLKEAAGEDVTADWVAAKMVGRWQDGRPLVGNPTNKNLFNDKYPDNDFSYGRDDPRGQGCPLGAHIRRANPRDSLEPGDPLEREIVKRHSILRRGRAYFYDPRKQDYVTGEPKGPCEKGLLFVALCADVERQFEMMQQSWLGFRSFHGLRNEVDPITARRRQPESCIFTIPTGSGPLRLSEFKGFVDVVGGGYFFLPSRSALRYLVNFTQDLAAQSVPIAQPCEAVPASNLVDAT